jgi:hypothetical protein
MYPTLFVLGVLLHEATTKQVDERGTFALLVQHGRKQMQLGNPPDNVLPSREV